MSNAASHAVPQVEGGRGQVSLITAAQWRPCHSELGARVIANGLNLAAAMRRRDQTTVGSADELEKATSVAVPNFGASAGLDLRVSRPHASKESAEQFDRSQRQL